MDNVEKLCISLYLFLLVLNQGECGSEYEYICHVCTSGTVCFSVWGTCNNKVNININNM